MSYPLTTASLGSAVVHTRRLKVINFTLSGVSFECQIRSWNLANNTEDGTKTFTYCPDSEFRTETDFNYMLTLTGYADWRSNGFSDFLWTHDRGTAAFVLDHMPDIVGEHVRWTGTCVLRAPSVGGDVRTIEETSVTLPVIGKPTFLRIG